MPRGVLGPISELPSIEELRRSLRYDRDSGNLVWLVSRGRMRAGMIAGCRCEDGYRKVFFKKRLLAYGRIIYALEHGSWPADLIDHRDTTRDNDTPENLRVATRSQNNANRRCVAKSGLKGAYKGKMGKFRSGISINGKMKYLGCYDTAEEANAAYYKVAVEIHGEFARAN